MRSTIAVLAFGFLMVGPVQSQGPDPAGEQFQVNTYATSSQISPGVAADAQGNFVVVWQSSGSYGTDTDYSSIQGQRYDAEGNPVGGEFQVNSYTTYRQFSPDVAVDADGNFVVVWNSYGSYGTDTDFSSIQAQRYDAEGNPFGGEFQVNSYTTFLQYSPDVAVDADGDFVVVWNSYGSSGSDSSGYSIQAQRYDAEGNTVGGEFQVNSYTTSHQSRPNVAVDTQSNFVVVWDSYGSSGSDSSDTSVQARRYDAAGNPVGSEFQVNSYTTNSQSYPAVAADSQGNFVVVWDSYGSFGTDTDYSSIQGQRYDAEGNPVGGEFQVNSYTTDSQFSPEVAVDADGNFVVVWNGYGSFGSDSWYTSVQARRYDASGAAVGGEFQVNSYTTSHQSSPNVAVDTQGDVVVVWHSLGSSGTDTDGWSVQGQRYASPIFTDGFESGDTSAWSSSVP